MEDKINNFFKNEIKNSTLFKKDQKPKKEKNKKRKKTHSHSHKGHCDNKCAGVYGFEKMSEKEKNNFYTKLIDSTKNLIADLEMKERENSIMENFIKNKKKENLKTNLKNRNPKKEEDLEIEISRYHIKKSQISQKIEKLKKILKYVK